MNAATVTQIKPGPSDVQLSETEYMELAIQFIPLSSGRPKVYRRWRGHDMHLRATEGVSSLARSRHAGGILRRRLAPARPYQDVHQHRTLRPGLERNGGSLTFLKRSGL